MSDERRELLQNKIWSRMLDEWMEPSHMSSTEARLHFDVHASHLLNLAAREHSEDAYKKETWLSLAAFATRIVASGSST